MPLPIYETGIVTDKHNRLLNRLFEMIQKKYKFNNFYSGYTVIEVLVALALFLMVIVPLMGYMSNAARVNKGREKLVAACLLEQEATRLRLYPDDIFHSKQRHIQGKRWEIRATFSGGALKRCNLAACEKGKIVDRVIFYLYDSEE